MRITLLDIVLSTLCAVLCLAAGIALAFLGHSILILPHGFQAVYLIAIFLLGFLAATLSILWLLRRLLPLREGPVELGSDWHSTVWKLLGYLYVTHLWPLMNASLVPVNLRGLAYSLLGARVGKSVMIGGKLVEPTLVEIGDYSMLGEDCVVTAHTVTGDEVMLGKIIIGQRVTIGGTAVVLPGVRIGDRAVVMPGAVVRMGTHVGPGEVWGGVPAKKIGQREQHHAGAS